MSDILRPNEILFTSQMLTSINGEYILTLRADGNMVLYEKLRHDDGSVVLDQTWSSQTMGENAWYAVMQEDGDFVLYDLEGVALWQSNTDGKPGSFLQLQDDGSLVINEIAHAWMAGSEEYEDKEEQDQAEESEADDTVDLAAAEPLPQQLDEAMADDALAS